MPTERVLLCALWPHFYRVGFLRDEVSAVTNDLNVGGPVDSAVLADTPSTLVWKFNFWKLVIRTTHAAWHADIILGFAGVPCRRKLENNKRKATHCSFILNTKHPNKLGTVSPRPSPPQSSLTTQQDAACRLAISSLRLRPTTN